MLAIVLLLTTAFTLLYVDERRTERSKIKAVQASDLHSVEEKRIRDRYLSATISVKDFENEIGALVKEAVEAKGVDAYGYYRDLNCKLVVPSKTKYKAANPSKPKETSNCRYCQISFWSSALVDGYCKRCYTEIFETPSGNSLGVCKSCNYTFYEKELPNGYCYTCQERLVRGVIGSQKVSCEIRELVEGYVGKRTRNHQKM